MTKRFFASMVICAICVSAMDFMACRTVWPIQGMVYDQDSRPVPGYRLSLDGWHTATTDINGRFTFAGAKYGMHTVAGSDERYLPFSERCSFQNRTEVLHIKLTSADSLYCRIDDQIAEESFAAAKKSLDSIPEKNRTDDRYRIYDSILRFRMTGDRSQLKGPVQ
jgi:hypothetical protein